MQNKLTFYYYYYYYYLLTHIFNLKIGINSYNENNFLYNPLSTFFFYFMTNIDLRYLKELICCGHHIIFVWIYHINWNSAFVSFLIIYSTGVWILLSHVLNLKYHSENRKTSLKKERKMYCNTPFWDNYTKIELVYFLMINISCNSIQ